MAKFLEAPTKPRVVKAVQYMGVENGAPTFNEPVPAWLLSSMMRGQLALVSGALAFDAERMEIGSWLVADEDDVAGDALRVVSAVEFLERYRPARRKPGPRSKAQLSVAAE